MPSLIDALAALFTGNKPLAAQSAPALSDQLAQPITYSQAVPTAKITGSGYAAGGINAQQLYPTWYSQMTNAQMNGQQFPSFKEWVALQGIEKPVAGANFGQ
jgi:hypothetical protein